MMKFVLASIMLMSVCGGRVDVDVHAHEHSQEQEQALSMAKDLIKMQEQVAEKAGAIANFTFSMKTGDEAKYSSLRKDGEICCMCVHRSSRKVFAAEDYGYNFMNLFQKSQECGRECAHECDKKMAGAVPYGQLIPNGCYQENMLAMLAPMFESAGLQKFQRDDHASDFC
eukprot:TRINITY_DN40483_c0_g1_i1.p1 TRINITY_DN40483_c0_g1~~TRINITY_DN40483_c0_g1_i1.p1  ORF type:complete len:170 (+),score=36.24 TRINITY_DN40483_c0_g1_i1:88-597(+)